MLARYEQATVETLEDPLRDWQLADRGLFLYGPAGTGKTWAAYALWRKHCADKGIRSPRVAPFLSLASYLRQRKAQFDLPAEARTKDIEWERVVQMAVFDDIDKARLTEWAQEELFVIIDALYVREVPIIVTSNAQSPRSFINHVGPYVGDRIKAMCVPHHMGGPSRRTAP